MELEKPVLTLFSCPDFVTQSQQWEKITDIFLWWLRCHFCLEHLLWLPGNPAAGFGCSHHLHRNRELCHGAGHTRPRCPCGLCPGSSLGFHMGFGNFFFFFLTSRVCSNSMLTNTLQLKQGRQGVKTEESFSIGQKSFVWANAKFLRKISFRGISSV